MSQALRRVAALYDVHGNLPALEAVLAEVEREAVDAVVVGGDIVLGPMPREALARLRALGPRARFLRGNCDRLVADAWDGRVRERLPAAVQESIRWVAGELAREERDFLAALPTTLELEIAGTGAVLFCHATPRSDEEILTPRTPAARVTEMLGGATQRLVVCGHVHVPYVREVGATRIANAGSVGMPYGDAGADWLLLGAALEARHTAYDLEGAAERVRATRYPDAAEFAARHVLVPPAAEAMLAALEPADR